MGLKSLETAHPWETQHMSIQASLPVRSFSFVYGCGEKNRAKKP